MTETRARRLVAGCASAALVALTLMPAAATTTTLTGTIVTATAGSPGVARMAFVANNNRNPGYEASRTYALGYVTPRPVQMTHFKIEPSQATVVNYDVFAYPDFDVFFYAEAADGEWPGKPLPVGDEDRWAGPGPACGEIPPTARWAIVTLSVGAADQFQLTFAKSQIGPSPRCK